jgi:hypothetical protein
MPEASRDSSLGTFDKDMKPLSRAITTLGYIFAIWCLYTSTTGWLDYSSEIEARRASLDTAVAGQTDSILRAVLFKTIVPQVLFALLLLIPYWKLKRRQAIPLLCLLLLVGTLFWRNTFGQYFLTERFTAELVPQQVWIASGIFFVFLIAFISVTAINTEKCRTFKGVAEARHEPSDCTHG